MSMKPTSKPSLAVPGDITETPDLQGAYPRLSDAQIAALTGRGDRRDTQPREILFGEGERDCDFYVVLAGHVASVEGHGTHATDSSGPGPVRWPQPAVRGPCRWRPAGLPSLPSAMSAAARPNESPRPSARARRPSGSPSKEPGRHSPVGGVP